MIRDPEAIDAPNVPERYELHESPAYSFELGRRGFVQVLGAGLLVSSWSAEDGMAQRRSRRSPITIDQRLHIGADGVITVMTSKVEVGQGSRTQLTQAAAEELRVPVDRVRLVMADSALVPDDGGTAGSRTTPSTVPRVRRGAAAAREALIDLAAQRWKTDRARLTARDGRVIDPASDRSVRYEELAADDKLTAAFKQSTGDRATITPVREWRVLGTSTPKAQAADLVTGKHRYPSDIVRPGMLYGKVLRPVSFGATLESIDLTPARAMSDVVVVRDGDFVGCAAPTSQRATQAIEALDENATWQRPPHPSSKELFAHLKAHAVSGRGRARTADSVEDGLAAAKTKHKASYEVAYVAHAPMEPRAAVAEWEGGSLTVWTGTQQPSRVRGSLADAFHIDAERVRVIVPDTGGGFGGKHTGEAAIQAARLARAAKRPVNLVWTREEEFTWAYFRPAGLIEIEAGLDADGHVVAWDMTNYNSGRSAIEAPYRFANTRTRFVRSDSPLRGGSYRALASTANTFARESFIDELAKAADTDPLAFRLKHLDHERLRPVLVAAVKRFDWEHRSGKSEPNRGVGLACGTEKGSYVAACVEVEVDLRRGRIRVIEVCQAFECGAIQNPANLRAQVEGCIIMGLGAALREQIEFEDGRIRNPVFSEYFVPRFDDVPKIDTVLLDRPDLLSVGAGETPIIAIAPAIANAVYQATGRRIRAMPMEPRLDATH